VRFLPGSLFGRLALLLLVVVAVALAATIMLFRHDRLALITQQFGDTKIVQLQAIRAALAASDTPERRESLRRIGHEYRVRIFPESERPFIGAPAGVGLDAIETRLKEELGPGTELRVAPGLLFVRLEAAGEAYWVRFALPPPAEDRFSRAVLWSLMIAAALLVASFVFARYLARPLRELNAAVERVGRGETPAPLPESGPSEIASLNRGVNRMTANLRQLEHDRALLLAGVSHDLRTPLARLRLGIEMEVRDHTTKRGMVDDVEEMDRVIGQFLEFARTYEESAQAPEDINEIVRASIERHIRARRDVRFVAGSLPSVPLHRTAFSRLVANLVDNAMAYGAPPVEVSTRAAEGNVVLEVGDHGPGIPPHDVERLKQPFTRASAARSNAAGIAGAGLGLAIVDRIARLHGGTFDILQRDGGGTLARVTIPAAA
jgi:two-component system osmolarity sensor histidine kinase EnvZ